MGAGRGRSRCALWGGLSLGTGTVAFALFSPSSVGCSTNVVVLTRSSVTARGCAAYSVVAHVGVGLIVLGAVLLLGSFALALRTRRQGAADAAPSAPDTQSDVDTAAATGDAATAPAEHPPLVAGSFAPVPGREAVAVPDRIPTEPTATEPERQREPTATERVRQPGPAWGPEPAWEPEPAAVRTRPIAPGEDVHDDGGERHDRSGLLDSAVRLPPGWYGNPNNPGKPIQWWDGTRLTDGPD